MYSPSLFKFLEILSYLCILVPWWLSSFIGHLQNRQPKVTNYCTPNRLEPAVSSD